jgi:hypothetical protein
MALISGLIRQRKLHTSNVLRPNCSERPPRPARMDEGMWRLVNSCWETERQNRPNIEVVVETLKCMPDSGYETLETVPPSHRAKWALEELWPILCGISPSFARCHTVWRSCGNPRSKYVHIPSQFFRILTYALWHEALSTVHISQFT